MKGITARAHDIEHRLEELREGVEKVDAELIQEIKKETNLLKDVLKETLENLSQLLPKELLDSKERLFFKMNKVTE